MYSMHFDYFSAIPVAPASCISARPFPDSLFLVLFWDPFGLLRAICEAIGLDLYLRAL